MVKPSSVGATPVLKGSWQTANQQNINIFEVFAPKSNKCLKVMVMACNQRLSNFVAKFAPQVRAHPMVKKLP
jgi:hypothetical protein